MSQSFFLKKSDQKTGENYQIVQCAHKNKTYLDWCRVIPYYIIPYYVIRKCYFYHKKYVSEV